MNTKKRKIKNLDNIYSPKSILSKIIIKSMNNGNEYFEFIKNYKYKKTIFKSQSSKISLYKHTDHEQNIIEKITKKNKLTQKEYNILTKIKNHKNIIKHIKFIDNSLFLEYCTHGDMYDLLEKIYTEENKDKINSKKLIKNLLLQLCDALIHIHSQNVYHCDIKPENLFLIKKNDKYILKLGDFGNASMYRHRIEDSGTLQYCCPEIINKKYPYDCEKADIYSFGVLCYVCWTNSLLFENDKEKIRKMCFVKDGLTINQIYLLEKIFNTEPYYRPSMKRIKEYLVKMEI